MIAGCSYADRPKGVATYLTRNSEVCRPLIHLWRVCAVPGAARGLCPGAYCRTLPHESAQSAAVLSRRWLRVWRHGDLSPPPLAGSQAEQHGRDIYIALMIRRHWLCVHRHTAMRLWEIYHCLRESFSFAMVSTDAKSHAVIIWTYDYENNMFS